MANHNSILTDEQVLFMREEARQNRRLNIREYARKYGVSHPTIHYAMVGKTFKHLAGVLSINQFGRDGVGRKPILTPEQMDEIVELRRQNPARWPYRSLAERCNALHGTHFGASNIKRIIHRRTNENISHAEGAKRPKKISIPKGYKIIPLDSPEARRAFVSRLLSRI